MTNEFLLDAIGRMDDDLVMEAAAPIKRPILWTKAAGWAAALVLCVGIAHAPALLARNAASNGTAAPEADMTLGDVVAEVDGKGNEYKYCFDQESQVQEPSGANRSDPAAADSPEQGVIEPKFFTERGVYLIIGDDPFKTKLSNDKTIKKLGVLAAAEPGKQIYPSTGTKELVGCPVWESEDGEYLYVQLPDGSWLIATLCT